MMIKQGKHCLLTTLNPAPAQQYRNSPGICIPGESLNASIFFVI